MTRLSYCFVFVLLTFGLTGCSISLQSPQYNFLSGLFERVEDTQNEFNWLVRWEGRGFPAYAINLNNGTLFGGEGGLIVNFDGWQVTDLAVPESFPRKVAVVEKELTEDGGVQLYYYSGDRVLAALDYCRRWTSSEVAMSGKSWRQQCVGEGGSYTNLIQLNEANELVFLKFMVVPGFPPIEISFTAFLQSTEKGLLET